MAKSKLLSKPDCVKKLTRKWHHQYSKERYLKSVSISGNSHLRGIRNSSLKFEFPVSVICGPNGAGKTTFLSLSTLGFHAKYRPLVPLRNIEYFDFNYFYKSTAKDKHQDKIEINWLYTDGEEERISKGKQRWMRYIKNNGEPRRPIRGTEFIGISRITPAFEKKNYHSYFSRTQYNEKGHGEELAEYISWIMSNKYEEVSSLNYQNSAGIHSVNNYNETHTSFNAGAGEECLSYILSTLINCPEGSFVAIEEIEIGLHPSTLEKLIDVILNITLNRGLQVLITSHSTEFLRAFPKEGLIYAERSGDKVEFLNQPNVEYSIRRIGGAHKPSVSIICEDEIAGKIISASLPTKVRMVCPVTAFGGKDELIPKALDMRKFSLGSKIAILWDGEVADTYIKEAQEKGFIAACLPGKLEPESYILSKLKTASGRDYLKNQYSLSEGELTSAISTVDCCLDDHDVFFDLASAMGVSDKDNMISSIVNFVCSEFSSDFTEIVSLLKREAGWSE